MAKNRESKLKTCVIIYYTADKKSRQVIRPKLTGEDMFNGNWGGLVDAVSGGKHHHFEIH